MGRKAPLAQRAQPGGGDHSTTMRSEQLQSARLYVVTPDRDPDALVDLARGVLRGGADVLQLRHKSLQRGVLLELARRLRDITSGAGALLIVNDHVDIAILAGAD